MTARTVVLGAGGQVGRAATAALPGAVGLGHDELDIARPVGPDWAAVDLVVNAAAYTDVAGAEHPTGRAAAWRANAEGPAALARLAAVHGFTLVHVSSDYVFDGRHGEPCREDTPFAPVNTYGASKAAGDLVVGLVPRHYVVRPSWLVGDGPNFVRTMLDRARRDEPAVVVADQVGRPTFAVDVAAAVAHLAGSGAPFGTYHVTGTGDPVSWADLARTTYRLAGADPDRVTDVATARYRQRYPDAVPRPASSVLDTDKARRAGVPLRDWRDRLAEYVRESTSRPRTP
ncbi:SDR family oxidoreductase [Actinokineospora enzanensis]|uniref:SDR family oxidoreductase n=1 Tax=Actinokineospora enzanensis TaxID=155975 RepID=UPI000367665B|nr:NAD(P)-dependent oxidoreductase [Actinokineospora enzanensis]